MGKNENLWGWARFLVVISFCTITYTVWSGLEITDTPVLALLSLWSLWLFPFVFDVIVPKLIGHNSNKWIERAGLAGGLIFYLFVVYTCEKGFTDNTNVYFNETGEYYHCEKDCDEIDMGELLLQSRRIEAERNGLEPCYNCYD